MKGCAFRKTVVIEHSEKAMWQLKGDECNCFLVFQLLIIVTLILNWRNTASNVNQHPTIQRCNSP